MPYRKLTEPEKRTAGYCVNSWRAPVQYQLLRELITRDFAPITTGPRGGRRWGTVGLPTRAYEGIKRNLAWYNFVLVEDFATGKTHLRVRTP